MEASPRVQMASVICSSSFVSFGRVIFGAVLLCSSVNLLHMFVLSIGKCPGQKISFCEWAQARAIFVELSGSRRRRVRRHQRWPIIELNTHSDLLALVKRRLVYGERKNAHAIE